MAQCEFYDSVSNSCLRGPHPPCKLDDCPIVPIIRKFPCIKFIYLVEASRNGEYIPLLTFECEIDAQDYVTTFGVGSGIFYSYRKIMLYDSWFAK